MLLDITDYNFDDTTEKNGLVIIDFWSAWCRPCNLLNPIIQKIAEQNQEVTFGKLNITENGQIASRLGISAIPTILFYKNNVLVKKLLGYHSEAQLQKYIDELK